MRLVGLALPFQDGPEHNGREEAGHGVDLTFNGAEPEAVTPCIGECTHHATAQDGDDLTHGEGVIVIALSQLFGQVGDAPEQEEDGEGAAQGAQDVDGGRHLVHRYKGAEHPGQDHEEGCPRGVAHLQFVGCGNEFPTIPETGRWLNGRDIGPRRHQEHQPTGENIELFERHEGNNTVSGESSNPTPPPHSVHAVFRIFLFSRRFRGGDPPEVRCIPDGRWCNWQHV